jgi:hypothetical protein
MLFHNSADAYRYAPTSLEDNYEHPLLTEPDLVCSRLFVSKC